MPKVVFIERNGNRKEVQVTGQQSLLQVAHANDIDMEGACEGSMACSTCHVIVADEWYAKLPKPAAPEEDMLDLTYGVMRTSRRWASSMKACICSTCSGAVSAMRPATVARVMIEV